MPDWQDGPFQGSDIETATEEEYNYGFFCLPVGQRMIIPLMENNRTDRQDSIARGKRHVTDAQLQHHVTMTSQMGTQTLMTADVQSHQSPSPEEVHKYKIHLNPVDIEDVRRHKFDQMQKIRSVSHDITSNTKRPKNEKTSKPKKKLVPRFAYNSPNRKKRDAPMYQLESQTLIAVLERKNRITRENCHRFHDDDLHLSGDVAYLVEEQFSPQARSALRLAHFLSDFLQNVDKNDDWGAIRGDSLMNVELVFAEVLSNVMADLRVKGSGVFFDRDKFEDENGSR